MLCDLGPTSISIESGKATGSRNGSSRAAPKEKLAPKVRPGERKRPGTEIFGRIRIWSNAAFRTNFEIRGLQRSTEAAFPLQTQLYWVRFPLFPRFICLDVALLRV